MKTSLKKLRGALSHKHDRDHSKILPLSQFDELATASQEMEDMRDCYDSLLSAAGATANSAYEFSESLREMGVCLLQKIALTDDEEAGKVLMMLGKVQFELQRLVDSYRGHIFQTITVPSESLLNELHIVEEMKHQCDEKREQYEYMRTRRKDKGRSKGAKGENISSQQLQVARDEFDDEATLLVFRLKSLKQGQSRSLLTQAARHHAAQLSVFKKALKSLEAVEPHVKSVAEQQHIEYHFTGLEDDESEDSEDDDEDDADSNSDGSSMDGDGELSFDYRRNQRVNNLSSASQKSVEADFDVTFPHFPKVDGSKENLDHGYNFIRDHKLHSQSAPLLQPRKVDPAARIRQLRPSFTRKHHSYVLPTPGDTKSSYTTGMENPVPEKKVDPAHLQNLWHSVPLEPKIQDRPMETQNISGPIGINSHTVLKESNKNSMSPPFTESISSSELNHCGFSHSKKIKRLSFSGPITSKPLTARHSLYSTEPLQFSSGPILRRPVTRSVSPKLSPTTSPTFLSSSPKINELHELPRPPSHSSYRPSSPSGLVGYSAPLTLKNPDSSTSNKVSSVRVASPLPVPPPLPGSSIPANSPRSRTVSPASRLHETREVSAIGVDLISPPLTPMSLPKGNLR